MTRKPPQQRRDELAAAAVRVIARDGMAAASTRAIAAEAGMSLASLHYVFGSRDALMEAVIERTVAAELEAATDGLLPMPGGAGQAALTDLLLTGIDHYIDLLVADPLGELALAELTVHASRNGLTDLLARQRAIYLDAARTSLEQAGGLAGATWTVPLTEAAGLLVTLLDGITYAWLAQRDADAARASGRFAARALAGLATTTHPATSGGPPC